MKKILIILLCLPLFFISCSEKKNKKESFKINFSKIIGKWEGKYTGNEKGTFIVYISDDGTVSGKTSFGSIINGRVKQNGNIKISTGEVNTGAIFTGNINNNKFTGTWKNSRYNLSGTFIAKKSKNIITEFENHKAVKEVKQKKSTNTQANLIKAFQPPNNWVDADLKSLDHPIEFMDAQAYLFTQLDEIAQKNNYKTLNKGSKLYNKAVVILKTIKMVRDAQNKWSSNVNINDRKKYNKDIKNSHSIKIMNNLFEKDSEIFQDWIDINRKLFEKFKF